MNPGDGSATPADWRGAHRGLRNKPRRPLCADLDRHIFAKRPRCKRCGSADLKTYKTLPKDGDAITRYVHCDGCGTDYILMLD